MEHNQQEANQRITALESNLSATSDALASRLGTTQQELTNKTAALQASQHAAISRLSQEHKRAIGEVKSDVVVTRNEVATARTRLEATDARLERTIGDLGVHSGLIARNRDELEILKHKGDRTYYEFTLFKGQPPTRVSTISLQLKKVDAKKNRFTLNVFSDDLRVEKKDRNTAEPLQFYSGRARQLYEVVVLTASKNQVTGYLATPKTAPDVTRLESPQ
jgi:hypothetical protein